MTRQFLNTLYVQTPDAYVRLDHDTVRVDVEGEKVIQVPLLHLGSIMLFGNAMMSAQLMHRCAEDGRAVVLMDYGGRFKAKVTGPMCGNVLLRQAQYETHRDRERAVPIVRALVAGKAQNMYRCLMRSARDAASADAASALRKAADGIGSLIVTLPDRRTSDELRGVEGQSTALYFEAMPQMITALPTDFSFQQRSRRPPRDRVNALLSFLYAMLANDCTSACEGVGLDPQFGFLHELRPGRPSLALDLMEEFRPWFADRLMLALINRRQIQTSHFAVREGAGESAQLTDDGRKIVLTAYQKRKQEEISHSLLKEKTPIGLLPHLQARLLARHLRGDIADYPPYLI